MKEHDDNYYLIIMLKTASMLGITSMLGIFVLLFVWASPMSGVCCIASAIINIAKVVIIYLIGLETTIMVYCIIRAVVKMLVEH